MKRAEFFTGPLHRLADSVWVGLAAAVLAWFLIQSGTWRNVELKLYDVLVVRSAPNKVDLPITIVGIDEATLDTLKVSWPLPIQYHTRILEKLREAQVAVVGFDVTFPDNTGTPDERAFERAINRYGRVVLASDLKFRESTTLRQWYRADPHPSYLAAGANQGYSSMEVDADAVLRRVPVVSDAFWRMMLAVFDKVNPGIVSSLDVSADMRIRWMGGPNTFTYVPYHHLLEPEKYLPAHWKEFFKDNIVLVGRKVSAIGDVGAAQGEVYQTPFFYKTREFMPRIEAHANLIANMVTGDRLREAPVSWPVGAWFSAVFIALVLMRRWHPLWSGIVLGVLVATLAGIEYYAFQQEHIWIPLAGAALTVALIYVAQGAIAFIVEQKQRNQIKGAFSMYVSPDLVDELIAHPDKLKLGGERRHMTILFTDLQGFTTISEQLDPEIVSGIVNRHLSDMCDVILENKGTVEKFLGDGIMAMWGAPVPDENQHDNAVKAAVGMQKRMDQLSAEIEKDTGAVLKMRVGVNCGDCVVGNMGGKSRFDYTVVGDSVNLASRLEGVNKVYGTLILVSEAVKNHLKGSDLKFREVDTVRVKGKNVGITVYTPCDDDKLIAMCAEALAVHRTGNLDESERLWTRVLEYAPGDPVAKTFLERVAHFRAEGLPPDWDGITTLDSK